MTVIVGMEHGDTVFIGGDIQGTGWNNKVIHTQPKVFSRAGVVFGFCGSYRFGQLIEHMVLDPVVPQEPGDIYRWLITVLVPSMRKTMKDADMEKGGNCLIGVKNQLWELQEDWSVLRSCNGYAAVGSGYEYANGSMFTTATSGLLRPGNRDDVVNALRMAVRAAGTFSPSVGETATIMSTDGYKG